MEQREPRRQNWGWRLASRYLAERRTSMAADLSVSRDALILLGFLGVIAAHALPSLSHGIWLIVIFLAVIWCAVGLFVMAGELLTKYSESHGDNKASNQSLQPTAGRSDE